MQKLNKIKLQDAVVLENREMKMIFGGSGSGGSCTGGGFNNATCSGSCDDRYVWDKEKMIMVNIPQTCKGITIRSADGSSYLTACGCM